MSLLREIQDTAVTADTPLTVVLRRCQVLGARIDHDPLRDWARAELDGYANVEDVPENHHNRLFAHQFLSPVAALEPLATSTNLLRVSWPNNAIAAFGDKLYWDMVLMEAHVELSPAYVAGILDTIRNRVLTFALEIEKEAPEAGEVPASEVGVSQHRINQIFHTYVTAPTGAITVGGGSISQTASLHVTPGDFATLRAALAELGLPETAISDLEGALAVDGAEPGSALGPATASWLDRLGASAGGQAINLGSGVTAGMITELLIRFLGG